MRYFVYSAVFSLAYSLFCSGPSLYIDRFIGGDQPRPQEYEESDDDDNDDNDDDELDVDLELGLSRNDASAARHDVLQEVCSAGGGGGGSVADAAPSSSCDGAVAVNMSCSFEGQVEHSSDTRVSMPSWVDADVDHTASSSDNRMDTAQTTTTTAAAAAAATSAINGGPALCSFSTDACCGIDACTQSLALDDREDVYALPTVDAPSPGLFTQPDGRLMYGVNAPGSVSLSLEDFLARDRAAIPIDAVAPELLASAAGRFGGRVDGGGALHSSHKRGRQFGSPITPTAVSANVFFTGVPLSKQPRLAHRREPRTAGGV
jgi:hypothetical protein